MRMTQTKNSPAVSVVVSMFFFFQAKDGIRDLTVTGVQTCALPIWCNRPPGGTPGSAWVVDGAVVDPGVPPGGRLHRMTIGGLPLEIGRASVGKEGSARRTAVRGQRKSEIIADDRPQSFMS